MARQPEAETAFDVAFIDAVRQTSERFDTRGVQIPGSFERSPVNVIIRPMRLPGRSYGAAPFAVLELMTDETLAVDGDLLRSWYGLSKAEARLAASFAQGTNLSDYAEAHDVAISTVRSQFASIRAKMNAADQAEVVRLALQAQRF